MKDEEYVFYQDIKEKKSTARGAFHKKGGSKSKKCTLPHEYLGKKEIEKMNGPITTWSMNKFYKYPEFQSMPADIQEAYLTTLIKKYRVGIGPIAKYVMGCRNTSLFHYIERQEYHKRIMEITPPKTRPSSIDVLVADVVSSGEVKTLSDDIPSEEEISIHDGRKIEDAVKKAVNEANKKLAEESCVSAGEVIADIRKSLGVPSEESWAPVTSGDDVVTIKPLPVPVERLNITMKGIDLKRIADILSWFENEPATVTLIVKEIPEYGEEQKKKWLAIWRKDADKD